MLAKSEFVVVDLTWLAKHVSREETSRFLKSQCGRATDEASSNLKLKNRLELLRSTFECLDAAIFWLLIVYLLEYL
jgi:hypothetical protein